MIHARIQRKSAGGRVILSDLDLHVPAGRFLAVTGPSGCGKTTLLRILAGLDRDFDGAVRRQGRLAMVFQEPNLLPWRSVADNILLAAPGAPVEQLLASVGLAGRGGALPGQLSLGMARRVSLARALAVEPDVLLLDEAFVSLDGDTAGTVRESVAAYWRRRRPAVVMVSHDPAELALAEQVYTMGAPYPQEYGMGPVKAMVSPGST